jgi:hypothetical protein
MASKAEGACTNRKNLKENVMSDQTSERNERLKATMRDEKSTNLNSGPAQYPSGPKQEKTVRRPTKHVDVGTGKRLSTLHRSKDHGILC